MSIWLSLWLSNSLSLWLSILTKKAGLSCIYSSVKKKHPPCLRMFFVFGFGGVQGV